uniref:Uncharacterized protein n=1 Tax=Cacopsylla melanoneura TaxID=428564 RepID=A0A8D9EA17_9HEMI
MFSDFLSTCFPLFSYQSHVFLFLTNLLPIILFPLSCQSRTNKEQTHIFYGRAMKQCGGREGKRGDQKVKFLAKKNGKEKKKKFKEKRGKEWLHVLLIVNHCETPLCILHTIITLHYISKLQ